MTPCTRVWGNVPGSRVDAFDPVFCRQLIDLLLLLCQCMLIKYLLYNHHNLIGWLTLSAKSLMVMVLEEAMVEGWVAE